VGVFSVRGSLLVPVVRGSTPPFVTALFRLRLPDSAGRRRRRMSVDESLDDDREELVELAVLEKADDGRARRRVAGRPGGC
jgi:hypothetical protein